MEIPEPLNEIVREWYAARNARDAERLARVYSEDAVIILPNGTLLRGREAVKGHYEHVFTHDHDRTRKLRFTDRRFFVNASIAHMISLAEGEEDGKYSFLDVFVRQPDGAFAFVFSSWTVTP